jgi:hypothetical protein
MKSPRNRHRPWLLGHSRASARFPAYLASRSENRARRWAAMVRKPRAGLFYLASAWSPAAVREGLVYRAFASRISRHVERYCERKTSRDRWRHGFTVSSISRIFSSLRRRRRSCNSGCRLQWIPAAPRIPGRRDANAKRARSARNIVDVASCQQDQNAPLRLRHVPVPSGE